jgi:hypothetical protein
MNLITHIFNRRVLAHNKCLSKVDFDGLSLRVYPHELEFLPGALDDVIDAEVEFAGHDAGVWFAREFVKEVEGDGVNFVVDV